MNSLHDAVLTIPENLLGLNFVDPLGLDVGNLPDKAAVAEEQGVDMSIFANLSLNFTAASAFSYLVFILLYTPCVAAMGAYVREFGRPYAIFIASWTMLLAVVSATVCYQVLTFMASPFASAMWVALSVALMLGAIFSLKHSARLNNRLRAAAV